MQDYQRDFAEFLLEADALRVGEFRLKDGRVSPLYLDTGRLDTGARLAHVGEAYAATLLDRVGADGFEVVFGPAYKGIPLAVATVMALSRRGVDRRFLADRKETKSHGAEALAGAAGRLLGPPPAPGTRFVLVDDVMTTGGTKEEAVALLRATCTGAAFAALLVILDRQEVGADGIDAVAGFTARTGIPVLPVLTAGEVVAHLHERGRIGEEDFARCQAYWSRWGTARAREWAAV